MADEKGYNGWRNYETWSVNLVGIGNDSATYNYWLECARDAWRDHESNPPWTDSEAARFQLADRLKDHFADAADEKLGDDSTDNGMLFRQLVDAALSTVDWDQIANALLETAVGDAYESARTGT